MTLSGGYVPQVPIPINGQNNSALYTLDLAGNSFTAGPYPWNPGAYEWIGGLGAILQPGGSLQLLPSGGGVSLLPAP